MGNFFVRKLVHQEVQKTPNLVTLILTDAFLNHFSFKKVVAFEWIKLDRVQGGTALPIVDLSQA